MNPTNKELYKIISEHGERMNFNVGIYENPTDRTKSRLARRVAQRFVKTFLEPLSEFDLKLTVGMSDLGALGPSIYFAVSKMDDETPLLILATPHDVIELNNDEET